MSDSKANCLGKHVYESTKVLEQNVLGNDDNYTLQLEDESVENLSEQFHQDNLKAAWVDEDDAHEVLLKRKRTHKEKYRKKFREGAYKEMIDGKYKSLVGTPEWALLDDKQNKHDDDDMLRRTGAYLAKSRLLPEKEISFKRCVDANNTFRSKKTLRSVEFHPTAQVLLTAGLDGNLTLFQIDGKSNPKIQNIENARRPLYDAHFSTDGQEVYMTSKYRQFYYYDMMAGGIHTVDRSNFLEESLKYFKMSPDGKYIVFLGKYGRMHMFSTKSKEHISTLKMNGTAMDIAFIEDGSKMISVGDEGDGYVWDMNTRDCVHRFTDDGAINCLSVDVSPNNQYIACGSSSGVVNIYDSSLMQKRHPKPLKAIMNLTTDCSALKFNPSSELLCAISRNAESAVKLIHVGTRTTFSNFPHIADRISAPYCMDFSINSGYLSIGDERGHACLYQLSHYPNY